MLSMKGGFAIPCHMLTHTYNKLQTLKKPIDSSRPCLFIDTALRGGWRGDSAIYSAITPSKARQRV